MALVHPENIKLGEMTRVAHTCTFERLFEDCAKHNALPPANNISNSLGYFPQLQICAPDLGVYPRTQQLPALNQANCALTMNHNVFPNFTNTTFASFANPLLFKNFVSLWVLFCLINNKKNFSCMNSFRIFKFWLRKFILYKYEAN